MTTAKTRISPRQGVAFWTIIYLEQAGAYNREIIRMSARQASMLFRHVVVAAPSLYIGVPVNHDGTLHRFGGDSLFVESLMSYSYAAFGKAELENSLISLRSVGTLAGAAVRTFVSEPGLVFTPGLALKHILAAGIRVGPGQLGHYVEPPYVVRERGNVAGTLDECRTMAVLYHVEARHLRVVMSFATSPMHRDSVASLLSTIRREKSFQAFAGTFGHLTRSPSDYSYSSMATSMSIFEENGGQSTSAVFRLRDFTKLFEIEATGE